MTPHQGVPGGVCGHPKDAGEERAAFRGTDGDAVCGGTWLIEASNTSQDGLDLRGYGASAKGEAGPGSSGLRRGG